MNTDKTFQSSLFWCEKEIIHNQWKSSFKGNVKSILIGWLQTDRIDSGIPEGIEDAFVTALSKLFSATFLCSKLDYKNVHYRTLKPEWFKKIYRRSLTIMMANDVVPMKDIFQDPTYVWDMQNQMVFLKLKTNTLGMEEIQYEDLSNWIYHRRINIDRLFHKKYYISIFVPGPDGDFIELAFMDQHIADQFKVELFSNLQKHNICVKEVNSLADMIVGKSESPERGTDTRNC